MSVVAINGSVDRTLPLRLPNFLYISRWIEGNNPYSHYNPYSRFTPTLALSRMTSLSVPAITVNGSHFSGSQLARSTSPQPRPSSSETASLPPGPRAYDFTYEKDEYNLIVYQYQGVGVLVEAVPQYEEAVNIAIKEFPTLANVPRSDIAICYETASSGKMTYWRISESAWRKSAAKFQPRTKLRIAVRGEDKLAGPSATGKPPPYESSEGLKPRAQSEGPNPQGVKQPQGSGIAKQRSGSSISSLFRKL
ncbi:hypothetical protein D9756_005425 [Leucocoprinus leucothites]|uniref:Uncharacterized protein n=1 Tax=Leucocoprinus leucothites TaxID=201217 RepID=A0A8H5FZH5_9AGAR|nr:hypothetical protein D9756_005425 [Leucoagaricus leucothites]